MPTVAFVVEDLIRAKPFLQEALIRGVINYAALAEQLLPDIKRMVKKDVQHAAIMMALRRLAEKLEPTHTKEFHLIGTGLILRSHLFEVTFQKQFSILKELISFYPSLDVEKGEFFSIIQGDHEIAVISSMHYKQKILALSKKHTQIELLDHLASLTIKIPLEYVEMPGFFYTVLRELVWENINVVETISTPTEFTLLFDEHDATRAYQTLLKRFNVSRTNPVSEN